MKNFDIFGFMEKSKLRGWGVYEKPIYMGGLPKKGRLGQFADQRGRGGGLPKIRGDHVFE